MIRAIAMIYSVIVLYFGISVVVGAQASEKFELNQETINVIKILIEKNVVIKSK